RRAMEDQRQLEGIEARGRDTRQRFGHAVDALGIDASRARDELKAATAHFASLEQQFEQPKEELKRALDEILRWEGRSAFQEPYRELAAAYRGAAEVVERWLTIKEHKKKAEPAIAARRGEVVDLEFQINQLRAALAQHEEALERDVDKCQKNVTEM